LKLRATFGDPIADIIQAGYALAIRTGDLDDQSGLITRRIASQRMAVCGVRSYLRVHGKPKRIDDLAARQAIIYRRSGRVRPWLFPQAGQPPREIMPAGRLRLGAQRRANRLVPLRPRPVNSPSTIRPPAPPVTI
jgi:DNA-binding transcriptional LysR family regulator